MNKHLLLIYVLDAPNAKTPKYKSFYIYTQGHTSWESIFKLGNKYLNDHFVEGTLINVIELPK